MNKLIAIVLMLGLAAAFVGCGDGDKSQTPADGENNTPAKTTQHEDPHGGFCMDVPEGWEFPDCMPASVEVSTRATKGKSVIEIQIRKAEATTLADAFKKETKNIDEVKSLEKDNGEFAGTKAKYCEVVYEDGGDRVEMSGAVWVAIKDGYLYRLRLTCPSGEFEASKKDFDIIAKSFKIQDDPTLISEAEAREMAERATENDTTERPAERPPVSGTNPVGGRPVGEAESTEPEEPEETEEPATPTESPFEVPAMVTQPYYLGNHIVEFETKVPGNWQIIAGTENDGFVFHLFSPKDKDGKAANCYIYVVERGTIKNMQELIPEAKSQLKEIKTNFKYIKGKTLQADNHECHVIYASEDVGGKKHLSVGGLYMGKHYVYYVEVVYTEKNFPAVKDTFEKMARSFKLTKEGNLQAPADNGGEEGGENAAPDNDGDGQNDGGNGGDDENGDGQGDGWDDEGGDGQQDDGWDDDDDWDDEGE